MPSASVVKLGGVPMAAAPWIVSDELWELIEPLLPKRQRSRPGGRRRHADRQTLSGIGFVLQTGIAWRYLPGELGFGSGDQASVPAVAGDYASPGRAG